MTYFQLTQYKTTSLNVPGGITNSQTTGIILTDVTNVDITKPGIVALTYAVPLDTTKVETVSYTSINGSNELVGVVRGVDNFSAKTHNDQCVVAFVISASHINNLADGLTNLDADFLVEHASNGTHSASITLTTPTLTSPVLNTAISGTAFLDEDNMASDSATKVASQQSIKAYVDSKINTNGWTALPHTLVYVSATSFKVVGVDVTSLFAKGTRIMATNNTLKYWVSAGATFSTDTTVTILTTTDYVVENTTISSPYYSYQVNPQGYPTWFNITPTTSNLGGFSSVAGYIWKWRAEGASCTMAFNIQGTSNAANFTLTAPVAVITQSTTTDFLVAVVDNGTWQASPGVLGIPSNTATFVIGKTIGSIAGGTYAGFTGSGTKGVDGSCTYQF